MMGACTNFATGRIAKPRELTLFMSAQRLDQKFLILGRFRLVLSNCDDSIEGVIEQFSVLVQLQMTS